MSRHLEGLPGPLLDKLVKYALDSCPSLRVTFLASLGSKLHGSAIRVLFETLLVPDSQRAFESNDLPNISPISPVLTNAERYSEHVKTIVICDLSALDDVTVRNSSQMNDAMLGTPAEANGIYQFLELCPNLEALSWESSFPPPEGLCEVLMTRNPRLSHFSCSTQNHHIFSYSTRNNLNNWNALSLPLFMYLPITSLHLSRLSQSGARAFSALLSSLGQGSALEHLSIDFIWLDDPLCEKIAEAGWRIRKLCISTNGTKLSDKGIISIIEGCDALEDLSLVEVQGRLSSTLWEKPDHYPTSLRRLHIVIAESGPHHSWTTDHLNSLHSIPLETLSSLSVVRREILPRLEQGGLVYESRVTDDAVALKPTPSKFVAKMKSGRCLTTFQCDFWAWSMSDIKVVLESCPHLETLRLCLDIPFSKLSSLSSNFASMLSLRCFYVTVNPLHAPGNPPKPIHPLIPMAIPTPAESPVLKSKSVLPQLLDFDQMQTQTCLSNMTTGDPSMPLLREIKRFVRKCPRLTFLAWYGKYGRGSWNITRPPTTSKTSINVMIEYNPPSIAPAMWRTLVQSYKHHQRGQSLRIVERIGQSWTGEAAEAQLAEREKEDLLVPPAENHRKSKDTIGKKGKLSTVSATSTDSSTVDPSQSSPSLSPAESSFPLTPPHSEHSFSDYLPNHPLDPQFTGELTEAAPIHRKRSPSEPVSRPSGSFVGRTRSATIYISDDSSFERRGSFPNKIGSQSSIREARHGRGRGRGGTSRRPKEHGPSNTSEIIPGQGRGARSLKYPSSRIRKPPTTT